MLKLLLTAMTAAASSGLQYTSMRCPQLNTLYISLHAVPLHSWIRRNRGGTGIMSSLITCRPSFRKCPTLDCAPPLQCTMPWILLRSMVSSIFFTTGAYVRVGDSTSLPTVMPVSGSMSVSAYFPLYTSSSGTEASKDSGYLVASSLLNTSWRAEVRPLEPMPPLYSVSYVAWPYDAMPTTTSPTRMVSLLMTSERFMRDVTVESTMTVRTRSPTSAVSPPVLMIPTPYSRMVASTSSVPLISAFSTSPGMSALLRPMVEDSRMLSTQPMHSRSSVFMITASCAMPRHTLRSPVSFQYMYARDDLVPAPSACMHAQYSGSPVSTSGTTLQNALGKSPLSTLAIAACTSSLSAETPRAM
mmetsp:Transcript_1915/g.4337  ORF Transcript_1915/g.4337 Transcript_1915/m.4337 type:complete len:358 (-) Transcript_1915:34-1107(-)